MILGKKTLNSFRRNFTHRPVNTRLLAMKKNISDEKKAENLAKFETQNERLTEMMKELEERNPWLKRTIQSIRGRAEERGNLTQKQKIYITSLYIDNCVRSDADIREQIVIRKLCYKLLDTHLGKMRSFVLSVFDRTSHSPFSPAQIRAIRNIAKVSEFAKIPEITDKNFDGWYFIEPRETVDK